jgi:hypothetical protein
VGASSLELEILHGAGHERCAPRDDRCWHVVIEDFASIPRGDSLLYSFEPAEGATTHARNCFESSPASRLMLVQLLDGHRHVAPASAFRQHARAELHVLARTVHAVTLLKGAD